MKDLAIPFGMIPPQARDAEELVLGAILVDKEAIMTAASILKPEHFYVTANQHIYSAMIRLFGKDHPVDIITVSEDLKANGLIDEVGGVYAISELSSRIASAANIEYHCAIIKEKWMKREVIRISMEKMRSAYEDSSDAFDLVGDVVNETSKILDSSNTGTITLKKQLSSNIRDMVAAAQNPNEKYVIGMGSGVYSLDRITLGFCPGDLVIVAGRPGHGKTAMAMHIIREAAKSGSPVGIFSLEVVAKQLANRLLAMDARVDMKRIRNGALAKDEWASVDASTSVMEGWNVYMNDTATSITELLAIAKGWVSKFGIKILLIDYLQLVEAASDKRINNREQEVASITRKLKMLSKSLGIPVVALSQLSRDAQKDKRRPMLSDLRESGAIEQDADMVIFCFRPDLFGITEFDDGAPTKDTIEFIVEKNRNGGLGFAVAKYLLDVQLFDDRQFTPFRQVFSNEISNRIIGEKNEDDLPF